MEKTLLYINDSHFRSAQIILQEITDDLNEIFGAGISVQPAYLLTEQQLVDGTSTYKFPLLMQGEINNTTFPLSYGVLQNDVFIGISRELAVDNRAATTSALIEWQTYFNKLVFTAANTSTVAHIQAIWNAVWSYKVGNKTFVQNQQTRKDLRQPRTQQSSANNWPEYSGSNIPKNEPYIVVSGKATQDLILTVKQAGFAAAGIGGTVNIISLYFQGFTLQNGAGFARFYTGDEDLEYYRGLYETENKNMADRSKWKPLVKQDSFANLGV